MIKTSAMFSAHAIHVLLRNTLIFLFVLLKRRTRYAMARSATRDIIKSLLAGIVLTLLIVLTRRLLPGGLLIPLFISAFLTIAVYGIVFKSYYRRLLRRG